MKSGKGQESLTAWANVVKHPGSFCQQLMEQNIESWGEGEISEAKGAPMAIRSA